MMIHPMLKAGRKRLAILLFLTLCTSVHASKVETFTVESKAMNKSINNMVILPDAYNVNAHYPVVFLLHGAGGNYKDWSTLAPVVRKLADQYQMLFVCPDGGVTSWYFDSPVDSGYRYETYVSSEVVAFVDSHYATIRNKSGRAITGLSMGGHGALYLAFRHQDIFGAAGSMSGGVNFLPFSKNWDIAKRLGTLEENPGYWRENTVVNLTHLLKGSSLKLIIDCGTEDFFYEVNQQLHRILLDQKYPHDFITRPGAHNWPYWRNAILYQSLFFSEFFRQRL